MKLKSSSSLNSFINTKAFTKLYIFILRRFGLFLIHLQSKNKATLGNASNSKPKDWDARNHSVANKTSKAKPRAPTLSNSQTVKAGPTGMQKVLKQNLHKIVIYVNKPRPAAKDYSQSTAKEGRKNCLTFSSSTISTIRIRQHQQQSTQYVLT